MISIQSLKGNIEKKGLSWQADETPLTGLSDKEIKLHLGLNVSPEDIKKTAQAIRAVAGMRLKAFDVAAPAAMDWRNNGGNFVTSIKDQQNCGSCVSFATCATIESRIRIVCRNAALAVDLSEAHLFFCGCP